MLARGVLCRLAADAPKTSPHDLSQLARAIQRNLAAHNGLAFPTVRALSYAYKSALAERRRSYATAAAATKPTETVKKAVKKTAAAKKTTPRKTATAAKKAAPKKKAGTKTTKATGAKKASKAKAKPKKTAAAKSKAKPKQKPKRAKKKLTEEEKTKLKIKELKVKALKDPGRGLVNQYAVFVSENTKGRGGKNVNVTTVASETAAKFKALSPAEREHYNHLAVEKTAARQAEYDAWVKSHTPEQIRVANRARALLRRKLRTPSKRPPKYTAKIHDDRQVPGVKTAYATFTTERFASGDLKGISIADAAKLISSEWKALSASEKKKYTDVQSASTAERAVEYQRVYGHDVKAKV